MGLPFTKIPNSLFYDKRLGPQDKLVLFALLRFNPSFPSYNKLVEMTGLCRKRIYTSINHLEKHGYLKRTRFYRNTSLYTFNETLVGDRSRKDHKSGWVPGTHLMGTTDTSDGYGVHPNKTKPIKLNQSAIASFFDEEDQGWGEGIPQGVKDRLKELGLKF